MKEPCESKSEASEQAAQAAGESTLTFKPSPGPCSVLQDQWNEEGTVIVAGPTGRPNDYADAGIISMYGSEVAFDLVDLANATLHAASHEMLPLLIEWTQSQNDDGGDYDHETGRCTECGTAKGQPTQLYCDIVGCFNKRVRDVIRKATTQTLKIIPGKEDEPCRIEAI